MTARSIRRSEVSVDAVFDIDGDTIVTSPHAAGPWDPSMQHGAAPSALVTYLAEAIPAASPMQVVRVSVDIMRPVPIAPLTFETKVVREGRKIQLCAVTLLAKGTPVASGSVLKVRVTHPELPVGVEGPPITVPDVESSRELAVRGHNPFLTGLSVRSAVGGFGTPGPGSIWFRMNRAFVAGRPTSPTMRAVIAADFSNGVSSALDFRKYTFLNADLMVSLSRPPVGEWILVDSESWVGPDGAGISAAKLADAQGYFGRSTQSLVIERR